MNNRSQAIQVGLFALWALLLLLFGYSWLKSFSLFSRPQRFIAQFNDVAGLSNNATVNVQGVRVGAAEYIEFTPDRKVNVHIKITAESLRVPEHSAVTIQTLGLVGAKYIEIALPKDPVTGAPVAGGTPIAENAIVQGEDPVRVELVLNKVTTRISDIVSSVDTRKTADAINHLSSAATKLNRNMDRMAQVSDSVENATRNISITSEKFGHTAESATVASNRASSFFASGNTTMERISELAGDFRVTSKRVNKLLDNPNFSGDLKVTLEQAHKTADVIAGAMKDVNATLRDKPLRDELVNILTRLQQSTENIKQSMEIVNKVSTDESLRSDLKDLVKTARDAMEKANTILTDPTFKEDLKNTMGKVRSAATNVDVAAKQINQVMSKRAPLLQMLFGRPGKLKEETTPAPQAVPAPVVVPNQAPLRGPVAPQ